LDDWQAEQDAIEAKRISDEAAAEAARLAEIAARELQDQVDRDHELALFMYAEHLRQKEEAAKQAIIDAENAAKAQKERDERIAAEAAENARIEAERAAAAEQQRIKDEAAKQAAEAQAAIERAQREKAEAEAESIRQQQAAEQAKVKALLDADNAAKAALAKAEADKQAAIEAERQRVAAELAQQAIESSRREKDTANKKRCCGWPVALSFQVSEVAMLTLVTAPPEGMYFTSGSWPMLPTMMTLFTPDIIYS